MASEAAEAEILIVCSDGDVILNTDTEKRIISIREVPLSFMKT